VATEGSYEIEFVWKETAIYWEGERGVAFSSVWSPGSNRFETVVPDAATWDRRAPAWLHGRQAAVLRRLRSDIRHDVFEERDDSSVVAPLDELTR
jgi:hypothetical protein